MRLSAIELEQQAHLQRFLRVRFAAVLWERNDLSQRLDTGMKYGLLEVVGGCLTDAKDLKYSI
jgi:hypothetical protein